MLTIKGRGLLDLPNLPMIAHVNLECFLQFCCKPAEAALPPLPALPCFCLLPLTFNSPDPSDGAQTFILGLQLLQSGLVLTSLVVSLQIPLLGEADVTDLTPESVRVRGQMESQLSFFLCPEVAEITGEGSPAAAIGVMEKILHTAGAEVTFPAGQSHGRTRPLLSLNFGSFSLLVRPGQLVFLQGTSPCQVDLAGLAPEFPRVDAEVIFEIVLPLCHKITLVAHEVYVLSWTWLIPGFGDTWVDFLHV